MNKEYGAFISLKEYKELLLAKEELNKLKADNSFALEIIANSNNSLKKAEDELKELLLMLTEGKTDFEVVKLNMFELNRASKIADYLNKNYVTEDNKLSFRKVLHEEKENKEEGTKNE